MNDEWVKDSIFIEFRYSALITHNSAFEAFTVSQFYVDKSQCSSHQIFPGVKIFTTAGDNVMLSLVEFEPHAVVAMHQHPHEQMGMLLEGELTFTIGGETKTLQAGEMWRIPGHVPHMAVAGDKPVKALDVFNPIREDYR